MAEDGSGDDGNVPSKTKVFTSVVAAIQEERRQEAYARHVAGRAAEPDRVTRFEVETARVEYLDKLEDLRKQGLGGHWPLTNEDRHQLEVLKLRYEAQQERFSEQRRAAESAESSEVIASNTELAKRQAHYARIVMWAVIVQAATAALTLGWAGWQALHPAPPPVLGPEMVRLPPAAVSPPAALQPLPMPTGQSAPASSK